MELTHGSLFAGIGGFDLGFERAGFRSVWQVEIDPYCRAVLQKHFPEAKRYEDVRKVGKANLDAVDVISGGFPCQDISTAGKRAGITGSRSGLWVEFRRIIDELRPRYVVVENVAALYQRGLDRVLGDLAESGYDAEWDCIPAAAFGAAHLRERIFIVAYSESNGLLRWSQTSQEREAWQLQRQWRAEQLERLVEDSVRTGIPASKGGGVHDGIPNRMDRVGAIGNSVYPDIAEFIAWRIREVMEANP